MLLTKCSKTATNIFPQSQILQFWLHPQMGSMLVNNSSNGEADFRTFHLQGTDEYRYWGLHFQNLQESALTELCVKFYHADRFRPLICRNNVHCCINLFIQAYVSCFCSYFLSPFSPSNDTAVLLVPVDLQPGGHSLHEGGIMFGPIWSYFQSLSTTGLYLSKLSLKGLNILGEMKAIVWNWVGVTALMSVWNGGRPLNCVWIAGMCLNYVWNGIGRPKPLCEHLYQFCWSVPTPGFTVNVVI